ncbi:MAG: thiol reductant ABC exporter subunit CydC [Micrococcales bacterium]
MKLGIPRDKYFAIGIFVAALQAVSAAGLLATSGWLISRAAEQPPVMYLMVAVVMVRGFALGRATFRYAERILLHDSTLRLQAEIRPRIFKALIPFSSAGLDKTANSRAISAIVEDVDELQNLPTRVIAPLVQSFSVAFLATLVSTLLVPATGLVMLIAVLLSGFAIAPLTTSLAAKQASTLTATKSSLQAATFALIDAYSIAKAYGWLGELQSRVHVLEAAADKKAKELAVSQGVGQSLLALTSALTTVLASWLAAIAVTNHQLAGVNLAVVALLPLAVSDTFQSILPVGSSWLRYRAAAKRTSGLLTRPVPFEVQLCESTEGVDNFEMLEFEDVSITYPSKQNATVAGVSFKLHQGEKISLLGQSGAGKSTIAKALIGHLRISSGKYLVNQQSSLEFDLSKVVGYLEQSPTILLGDVRQNLLLAKPDASDEELLNALRQVGLETMFLKREGLSTQLGEKGSLISGGEAQRLAMARLLLAKFPVLILDEPTSNLDQELASALTKDLLQLASQGNRAVILITHQMEYARLTDRCVEIK